MLFFRSEEAFDEWLASRQTKRGAVFSIPQLWNLSQPWYQDRLSPDFHGRTVEQARQIFREAGLTSAFWQGA
ncbi:MAG: hypothetical protein ACM3Y8_02725 [Byssovorax cruenta]